jgi:hypothetical protein
LDDGRAVGIARNDDICPSVLAAFAQGAEGGHIEFGDIESDVLRLRRVMAKLATVRRGVVVRAVHERSNVTPEVDRRTRFDPRGLDRRIRIPNGWIDRAAT